MWICTCVDMYTCTYVYTHIWRYGDTFAHACECEPGKLYVDM